MKVIIEDFASSNVTIKADEIDNPKDLDVLKSIMTIMEYQRRYFISHDYKYAETLEELLELKESWHQED